MASNLGAPSSFQKRAKIKIGQISGTRPSLYNNQLLISTGIPSFDNVIGGGLAVGTVLLVEEDTYSSYAKIMLKYFIAEGVMTGQSIFLSSAKEPPQQLIKELPAPIDDTRVHSKVYPSKSVPPPSTGHPESQKSITDNATNDNDKMKIAWRYQSQPKVKSSPVSNIRFGHYYDLTQTMPVELIDQVEIVTAPSPLDTGPLNVSPVIPYMNAHYCHLLDQIRKHIDTGCFGTAQNTDKRKILRICISSIGSPLWGEMGGVRANGEGSDPSLPLFFIGLRGILRSAFAVAMITVPAHLFHDRSTVKKMERLCDTVVKLDSFAGSEKEKNPVFKEYHGLIHLVQLPRLNSLIPAQHETSDLAFKLRRKKLTIEKLHLPPELRDPTGGSQEGNTLLSSHGNNSGCGTSQSSKLSF
ncbi:unnamed protein product [Lymnaea stagnalis]|uniref:Elongator complex protein 4 n=1 Tax=Lymnaea stagnalis TaxID=6523 RepID=A0AAV2H7C8_LYMST